MMSVLLDVAIKSSLLLAGAGTLQAVLRRRGSAAARHLVWTIAMAGLLAAPIASSMSPPWKVEIPVARATETTRVATPAVPPKGGNYRQGLEGASVIPPGGGNYREGSGVTATAAINWMAAAIALYAAGVLLLLVRLGLQPVALRRLLRDSRIVTDPAWTGALERAARRLRLQRPVRLLQSVHDVMPMTFGTRRPAILVPASAERWTGDRRLAVLLHELAHVARRDCATQMLSTIACALYWPHPGVWWAARRMRVERELACDDRVLTAGTEPRAYAGHLLEIAHSLGATPAPAIALGMARARQLESRLLAVMDAARNRAAVHRRGRVLAAAATLAVLLPIAVIRAAVVPVDVAVEQPAARTPSSPAQAAAPDVTGSWEARLSPDGKSVQLNVRTAHGSHGTSVPLAQLQSLTGVDVSTARGPVTFTSRRDAGTFTFEGVCRSGVCGGTSAFQASQTFAADLARRGIGAPTAQDQFRLAVADIGIAYLDELARQGYAKPDLPSLVRAADHGVSLDYLRSMASLGYKLGTLEPLIGLRDHGVDPEYVRGMSAAGYPRLAADDLQRARDHGVDPEYARGMAALGYKNVPLDALIQTRDHGVDPDYVRGMGALGYKDLPVDALVRMRDHGVDPDYVRRLQQRGAGHLSVDELIHRRDRGQDDSASEARQLVESYRLERLWRSLAAWLRG
jgi:beta-lactamase regulating signal transducer with metallopeptidase domain